MKKSGSVDTAFGAEVDLTNCPEDDFEKLANEFSPYLDNPLADDWPVLGETEVHDSEDERDDRSEHVTIVEHTKSSTFIIQHPKRNRIHVRPRENIYDWAKEDWEGRWYTYVSPAWEVVVGNISFHLPPYLSILGGVIQVQFETSTEGTTHPEAFILQGTVAQDPGRRLAIKVKATQENGTTTEFYVKSQCVESQRLGHICRVNAMADKLLYKLRWADILKRERRSRRH